MKTRWLAVCWVVGLAFLPGKAFASGFALYGMGGDGLSRADAVSASVNDASAVWYSPARIANLEGTNVEYSPNVLWYYITHKSNAGQESKNDGNVFLIASFYATSKFNTERWGFGYGINAPYGLGHRYSQNNPFKASIVSAELLAIHVSPVVAYKVSDQLSLGAGINYYIAKAALENNVGVPVFFDGKGDALGFTLSAGYQPAEKHSLALTYRSQNVLKLDGGDLVVQGVSSEPAETTLRFPDSVVAGYAYSPNEDWTYEGDVTWWNYNDVSGFTFTNSSTGQAISTTRAEWKNSFMIGASLIHKLNDRWGIKGGYYFAKTPIPDGTYDMLVPDMDAHLVSVAPVLNYSDNLTLHMPVAVSIGPSRDINSQTEPGANGEVKMLAFRLGATASYRFGGSAE